jgi:hypothetical protein
VLQGTGNWQQLGRPVSMIPARSCQCSWSLQIRLLQLLLQCHSCRPAAFLQWLICLAADGAAACAVPRVCARVPAAGAVRRITRSSRPAEAVQVRGGNTRAFVCASHIHWVADGSCAASMCILGMLRGQQLRCWIAQWLCRQTRSTQAPGRCSTCLCAPPGPFALTPLLTIPSAAVLLLLRVLC